jgi:glycosyltransferase involved in cell wall biosynthesis
MRVLHVTAGNLYGGIETLLLTLAHERGLCPAMHPQFALCFGGRLRDELTAAGVPVHPLGPVRLSRPWTVWRARRRLDAVLAQGRAEAVICHGCWPHAVFAPVVRARGLPLVFWAHDVPTGRHWLERLARRTRPNLVLANSRLTRAALPNLFADVPSEVLYAPVPAPGLADRDRVRREVRAALHTPLEATVILQACRLERLKGHLVLLQALDRLRDLPDWVCWIAGGPQRPQEAVYFQELRSAAGRLGLEDQVRFLGQRSDVPRLLAAADLLCQPNTGPESFGLAFVEALDAGLPVVTTALGGALEVVDAACGVLVPPGDPAALAQALRGLVNDPATRARLSATGPDRARQLCAPAFALRTLGRALTALGNARQVLPAALPRV